MDGRLLALLILVVAALAITDERAGPFRKALTSAARQALDDDAVARGRADSSGDDVERPRRRRQAVQRSQDFVTETIPVADLLHDRSDGLRPRFEDAPELIAFVERLTGRRNWRRPGRIEWLDRRSMIRVTQSRELIEQVRTELRRCRALDTAELRVTIQVIVLPAESSIGPDGGDASVLSARELERLIRRGEKRDIEDRRHCSIHCIPSGDVIYAHTAAKLSNEDSYRGVNVVCRAERDARGATLMPIPYAGERDRVDWPEVFLPVGQSVVFDLPPLPRDTDVRDPTRALALVTLDAVTPAGR